LQDKSIYSWSHSAASICLGFKLKMNQKLIIQ